MKDLIAKIEGRRGCKFRPGTTEELSALKKLRFPKILLDFYSEFMLDEDVDARVSMLSCYGIIAENKSASPGIELSRHRIFVFTSTCGGDTFCFDTNNTSRDGWPRIVFSGHCEIGRWSLKRTALKSVTPFAADFPEFLRLYADDKVPDFVEAPLESN